MKNVLVTGANGQLGSELRAIESKLDTYFFTDVAELDVLDKQAVAEFVKKNAIQIIVNCAAYTNVDKAEEEPKLTDSLNHIAVKNLAEVCVENKVTLIHISTDYVFDGTKNTPYSEEDFTSPLGVYGQTKLEGEKAVESICDEYLILRTSWLYSALGNNFAKTIQRLSKEKNELKVVFDQVGTPTYAADLAAFISFVIENAYYRGKKEIYHFSNEGVCSWYDFAKEIVVLLGENCNVKPCYSTEYPAKVVRPCYSVLDKTKLKREFGYEIPHWRASLMNYIGKLKK